jgi:hypothetical protein
VLTGLLYISLDSRDLDAQNGTVPRALVDVPYEQLCPGNDELQQLQQSFR